MAMKIILPQDGYQRDQTRCIWQGPKQVVGSQDFPERVMSSRLQELSGFTRENIVQVRKDWKQR